MKDGDVGADGELEDQLAGMGSVVVILREAFADFAGCDADDGVGIGVVAGGAAKDLDPDAAFFELSGVAQEGLLDDIGEEGGVALAVGEKRVGDEALELFADGCRVRNGDLLLQILHGFRRHRHVQLLMRLKVPRGQVSTGKTPSCRGGDSAVRGFALQKWQRGAARSKPCRIS